MDVEVSDTDIKKAHGLFVLLVAGAILQILVMVGILYIFSQGGAFDDSGSGGATFGGYYMFTLVGLLNLTLIAAAVFVYLRSGYYIAWVLLLISIITTFPGGTIFAVIGLLKMQGARKAFPNQLKKMIEKGGGRRKAEYRSPEPIRFIEKEALPRMKDSRSSLEEMDSTLSTQRHLRQHPFDRSLPFKEGTYTRENPTKGTYRDHLPGTVLRSVSSSIRDSIPDYSLTHKIGSGGFAHVYRAKDRFNRTVAMKVPKFLDETIEYSELDRYRNEASIWGTLNHPNIVKFYTCDTIPVPYLASELLEGGSLGGLMKNHRLTVDEVIGIMLQILDGLSYAHRMGIIHRDIKPENILFTKNGIPKISDWGIGKYMASTSVSTTGGTKGTFQYSAPEQFDKKKYGKVDWQTDIFQIGIVFYEMLTGRNPFYDEELVGVMGRVLNEVPEPLSVYNKKVTPELDHIVMRALEKRKEDRWRSADVMYDRLKELVDG